jgi:hypothetical protein
LNSQTCAACGCDVPEIALRSGRALRHGSRVYCNECANLIMSPEERAAASGVGLMAAGQPEQKVKSTRMADGIEVVEEFRISAGPLAPVVPKKANSAPARVEESMQNTEDDWFKPAKQSGRNQVAEAEPPQQPKAAPRPAPSARVAASPKASGRINAVKPAASGRTNAVKPSGRFPKAPELKWSTKSNRFRMPC